MSRIVEINTVTNYSNSVARLMRAVTDVLRTHGHEVAVAACEGPLDDEHWRVGSMFTRPVHALLSRLNDTEGLHSILATRALVNKLRRFRPDLVHLHNLHGHYLHLPTLFGYLREAGIPVVLTLHDCWWLTGHCAYYTHRGCVPSTTECGHCRHFRAEYPRSYRSRCARNLVMKRDLLLSLPDIRLVTPSKWLADEVAKSPLAHLPVTVIANGTPAPPEIITDRNILLAAAAYWTPNKGLDDVINLALSGLSPYPLTVLGDTMGRKLPTSITSIRHIDSPDELAHLYSRAVALLNPTRAEAFGLVTIEAMACGTPVIGNPATATAEIIGQEGGIAVDTSATQAIVDAVNTILSHPERFSPRARVETRYTIDRMTAAYLSLINSALR